MTSEYSEVEEIREITVKILESLEEIPVEYLRKFSSNKSALKKLPYSVKRKVFENDPNIFYEEILPFVDGFIDKNKFGNNFSHFYMAKFTSPKSRRNVNKNLQEIVKIIGDSKILYVNLVNKLTEKFRSNFNILLAALRFDIAMALFEKNFKNPLKNDRCFELIKNIDFCLKENKLNSAYFDEVKNFILNVPEEKDFVSEVAMVACNPHFQVFLCRAVLFRVDCVVEREKLPKSDIGLKFISNLLLFSISYKKVIEEEIKTYPAVREQVFTVFYPLIAMMVVEEKNEKSFTVNPICKQIADQYELPKKILLTYFLALLYKNDFERSAKLGQVIFDEDCFSFCDENFIFSFYTLLIEKLPLVSDRIVKINLLRVLVFLSIYSGRAHYYGLKLVEECFKRKLASLVTLKNFYAVLKEKGMVSDDFDLKKASNDVEKILGV